ncbi:hypothetical protein L7F22_024989 [Adiantum nelumboides]|nr:hypothetical protein [Adiantum nelumboides]
MTARAIERDEDLTLFHEMQRRDHERRNMAMRPVSNNSTIEVHSARFTSSSLHKLATSGAMANVYRARTAGEELLASDMGKNDYDWLLTPPGTPLIMGSENDPMADMTSVSAKKGLPNLVRSLAAIKTTRLSSESSAKSNAAARAIRSNPAHVPNRRSSLAPTCATPSTRATSRPSTPTNRPMISTSAATSSSRSMAGSSTRSSASSRSTTPLRRPSTPVLSHTHSQPMASVGGRSSSASKVSSSSSRTTPASQGNSPTMRPRPWQPSAMPGFSLEQPPNLRTSVPNRSISNSRGASVDSTLQPTSATTPTLGSSRQRVSSSSLPSTNLSKPRAMSSPCRPGRPGASLLSTGSSRPALSTSSSSSMIPSLTSKASALSPSSTSSSSRAADPPPDRSRRQSSSPGVARGRTPTVERSSSRNSRGDCSPRDPAGRGRMLDRPVQSRRAATLSLSPEKLPVLQVRRAVKPVTPTAKDNTSFGKAMSRKSIDMALRHMDIRQSASNGLRPLVSNMPSSSFYTVRSLSGRGVQAGCSPRTTSSTMSSEYSMSIVRDLEGSELEDVSSEVGSRASPRSVQDCMFSVAKEARVTKWVDSGDFNRESSIELMQMFRKGMEKVGGQDSPASVGCPHHLHGGVAPCELCNLKSRLQSLKASPMSAAESLNLSCYSGSSNGVPSPASSLL